MNSGFSAQNTFMQIDSGTTIAANNTYYFQADFRLEEAFNNGDWAGGTGTDRPITQILRYTSGGADIFSDSVTIRAATSAAEWTTSRFEFSPGDLIAGNSIFLRCEKGDFGAGEEAIWIDNVEFGQVLAVPEPSTALLCVLGSVGLGMRRKRRLRHGRIGAIRAAVCH